MGRASEGVPGHIVCVEREVTQVRIHSFMDSGKCTGQLVRGMKWEDGLGTIKSGVKTWEWTNERRYKV